MQEIFKNSPQQNRMPSVGKLFVNVVGRNVVGHGDMEPNEIESTQVNVRI